MNQSIDPQEKLRSAHEGFLCWLAECLTWSDPVRYPRERTQRHLLARAKDKSSCDAPILTNEEEWFACFAWQIWVFTNMTPQAAKEFSRRWIAAELDEGYVENSNPLHWARKAVMDYACRGGCRVH